MGRHVVLITGAAGGLGSAIARELALTGSDLLLVDKDTRGLEKLSDLLVTEGLPEPGICTMDLAKAGPHEYEQLAMVLREEFNGLDAFIHCASAFGGLQPIEQVELEQWWECFNVNLLSAVQIIRCCNPMLRAHAVGKVVLIEESDKVMASAYWGPYGVSKAALRSFAAILAEELDGTKVELIRTTPKPMRTGLRARAYLAEDPMTVAEPKIVANEIVKKLGR